MSADTAAAIARAVRAGERSAGEIAHAALDRIRDGDGDVNAFTQVFDDHALEAARAVDEAVRAGRDPGPLAGVPVAVKDNICLDHGRTTCSSRMLEHYASPFTATAARRLLDAGAVVVGKTNMDEFGMGSSCEHSIFGCTRNPWDHDRVAGGSSGGSAAAVAAGFVPLALGSDTGGSIRQPAALCGIVGLKPTYGRVSRYGLVAYASSLDQIGPMTRTVQDAALVLDVLAGPDPLDATSAARHAPDALASLDQPVRNLRIGVPRQACHERNHPGVGAALDRAADALARAGAEIVEIDLAYTEHAIAAYYIVAPAEASSNLARYDGIRYGRRAEPREGDTLDDLYARSRAEGFGPEVQRRIMLGTHVLSSGYHDAYYTTALRVRRLIKGDYDSAFAKGVHAVLMPPAPDPAFRIGEKTDDPMAMYLEDVYTVGVNLAGLPAISVPAGFCENDGARLPVGVQLVGPAFEETMLLRVARTLERQQGFGAEVAPRANA